MTDYLCLAGSTDVSVNIFIFDPATGLPDSTVVFNTSGLDLEYRREGAASTDITEVTLAALTTAHTDGGFLLIGNGHYRLDLPDAAVASGVKGVRVHGALTSRVVVGCYVHLVAFNPFDAVRLGLTALPASAPGATGGLATYDDVTMGVIFGTVDDSTSPTGSGFSGNSGLSSTDDFYNGRFLIFTNNTLGARKITDYVGSTRTFSFSGSAGEADAAFPGNPTDADTFIIFGFHGE